MSDTYPPDAAEKTQAVLDAINAGEIDPAELRVGFWGDKAAEQAAERQAAREMEAG
jgi:hypothetical protein